MSRSAALAGYAAVAAAVGLDPYGMVLEAGLPIACLADPDLKISSAAMIRLMEDSAARAKAPDFGLRMAEQRQFSNLGALGLVAREQSSVRQAIEAIANNSWAHVEGVLIELEDADDIVSIKISVAIPGVASARQASELIAAVLVRFIARRQRLGWRPEMVMFTHKPPGDLGRHLRQFGQAPLFSQPFNAIVVSASELDNPIPDSDPVFAGQLSRYLNLTAGRRGGDFSDTVRELILVLLPRGACSAQRIAQQLGIDRRTLHRRLAALGSTFETAVLEVRIELAKAYLQAGDLPMKDISDLLGFSSPPAFSRWRKQHLPRGRSGS